MVVHVQQVWLSGISAFMIGAPRTGEVVFSSTLLWGRHALWSARHVIDILHVIVMVETRRVMRWIAIGRTLSRFHAVILGVVARGIWRRFPARHVPPLVVSRLPRELVVFPVWPRLTITPLGHPRNLRQIINRPWKFFPLTSLIFPTPLFYVRIIVSILLTVWLLLSRFWCNWLLLNTGGILLNWHVLWSLDLQLLNHGRLLQVAFGRAGEILRTQSRGIQVVNFDVVLFVLRLLHVGGRRDELSLPIAKY